MIISVIIPVYKVEKYIRRCLESVIRQESDDYKIECLIIDDGSPDKSIEIVNEIVNNYKGTAISFTIINHKRNRGLSVARNTGIRASTGDYLFLSIQTMTFLIMPLRSFMHIHLNILLSM